MPSKGPSTITQKSINPTEEAQLPFLTQGWNQAKNLYETLGGPQYYPGQTLATPVDPNPLLSQGYNNLVGTAYANDQSLRPAGNSIFANAASGGMGVQNSPAYQQMLRLMQGSTGAQQGLEQLGYMGAAAGDQYAKALGGGNFGLDALASLAKGGGLGMSQLANTISGQYLNPASNPYIRSVVDYAQRPVEEAYRRSTAPQTDYAFANSGRYGSGAMLGARSQNEENLGRALGDISSNIYSSNYQAERARQDAAANQFAAVQQGAAGTYGSQYAANQTAALNSMLAGIGRASANTGADLTAQQAGVSDLQSGYQSGNSAQLSALQQFPAVLNAQYSGANNLVTAGQGLSQVDALKTQNQQALINDAMARYNYGQNQPWQDLSLYQKSIGQPTTASKISTSPNPANSTLGALSGLVGGVNLLDKLGSSSTLGSIFGGGSAALPTASSVFSSALASDAAMTAAGIPSLGSGLAGAVIPAAEAGAGLSTAAAAAPAAAAMWIICTELMCQGRMPKRWYLAGYPTFASYPEIGKRGYYVWAIPSVRHLRRHPNSLYSRALCKAFNWRAEDIAGRRGVKGARKLWRGRAVTAALVLPCLILGVCSRKRDWRSVYA